MKKAATSPYADRMPGTTVGGIELWVDGQYVLKRMYFSLQNRKDFINEWRRKYRGRVVEVVIRYYVTSKLL